MIRSFNLSTSFEPPSTFIRKIAFDFSNSWLLREEYTDPALLDNKYLPVLRKKVNWAEVAVLWLLIIPGVYYDISYQIPKATSILGIGQVTLLEEKDS